jgi:signal transduction histidine kinase
MQAHGGTIVALPGEYGEGTLIEMTLPFVEPPEPEAVEDSLEEYV